MFLELFSKRVETWGWLRKQNAAAGWGADLRTRHTGPWWGADLRTRHTGPWLGPGNSSWWSGRGSQWGPGHSQHTPGTNNKNEASRVWRILIRSEPHHIAGSAKNCGSRLRMHFHVHVNCLHFIFSQCIGSGSGWIRVFSQIRTRTLKSRIRIRPFFL